MSLAIVWFRRDLRLADNPALAAALADHQRVLPVYLHAPGEEAPWSPGAASGWWLHHALADLKRQLGGRLLLLPAADSWARRGPAASRWELTCSSLNGKSSMASPTLSLTPAAAYSSR